MDALHPKDMLRCGSRIGAHPLTKGALHSLHIRQNFSFDDDLAALGNGQIDGSTGIQSPRFPANAQARSSSLSLEDMVVEAVSIKSGDVPINMAHSSGLP